MRSLGLADHERCDEHGKEAVAMRKLGRTVCDEGRGERNQTVSGGGEALLLRQAKQD